MAGLGLAQVLLALLSVVLLGLLVGMAAGLGFLAVLAAMIRKRRK
jgi:hypothetical protein